MKPTAQNTKKNVGKSRLSRRLVPARPSVATTTNGECTPKPVFGNIPGVLIPIADTPYNHRLKPGTPTTRFPIVAICVSSGTRTTTSPFATNATASRQRVKMVGLGTERGDDSASD